MTDTPTRMPAVFLGHGNPMNALQKNVYTRGWAALGAELPRPRAVLASRGQGDSVELPVEGVDGGSVSMLAVQFGRGR